MSDLNKVMIIGRLGADPETRYTPSGSAITNLSVATSEKWRDKQTGENQERTEWHRVVFFGRTAEIAGEYLHKGSQVFVEGKLQTEKWTDRGGTDRYTTKVIGSNLSMLGGKTAASVDKPQLVPALAQEDAWGDEPQEDIPF